ncbi:bifunctional helix-turn-helix transcriptional regulator/GNAT family N-acetyltransferase [Dyadobacter sp. NIV53]|uniref:bifunctional helix-turn-helix transcriptional regulator/GNAT family N-acetyltransferase n=1 Tax=Dyadobacter sp. NIV53 TaxID=2861765 RepID=UPI001C870A9F|nr:bifunctional helix-turn-helix transcriptional regulator/GNAT family N-acetyltransferase [Dyadobacter sp. NIV53]
MNSDFFQKTGPTALGSRLRQVGERFTQEAAKIYTLYGVQAEPRWFPVLYALAQQDSQSVAQLAETIGHSQASVSQIIKEMDKRDFIVISKPADDARKSIITLSEKATQYLPMLKHQIEDVGIAAEEMMDQMNYNLWKALDELNYLMDEKSFFDRVQQQRKKRESQQVLIVDYSSQYHDAFRALNVEWITTYFAMEDSDYEALDHPDQKIIEKGGCIIMALYQDEPVGTCALIKMNDTTYELAKMAVSPKAQGKHAGWLLGQAILQKATELGAEKVYLESNTMLKPAINLYHKLGFERIVGATSPYKRCNIQMEVTL